MKENFWLFDPDGPGTLFNQAGWIQKTFGTLKIKKSGATSQFTRVGNTPRSYGKLNFSSVGFLNI